MGKKFHFYMFIIVLLLGIPATLITYLFIFIIDNISIYVITYFSNSPLIILIPGLGGLLVGLILKYGNLSAKGHGVPLLLATIESEKTGLTKRDLNSEVLATTLTIITGGSVGLVGPIIELTTGITDLIGRYLKFNLLDYQILIGSGAAASFAAVFQAPIAGIIFSLEVIHKDWSLKNLFYTSIAAFSGFWIMNLINPKYIYLFQSDIKMKAINFNQYMFILLFAFFISFIGWLFINILLFNENLFCSIEIPLYLKPVIGGLLVGYIGYYYIQIMGTSSTIISGLDQLKGGINLLFLILLLKILATGFSIGSGGSGGLFAPMILIGLLSGLLVGNIGLIYLPVYAINPLLLALFGIAGIFGGLIKAPITGVILILELFYLPNLIIPLILISFIPYIILNLLGVQSIYSPTLFKRKL